MRWDDWRSRHYVQFYIGRDTVLRSPKSHPDNLVLHNMGSARAPFGYPTNQNLSTYYRSTIDNTSINHEAPRRSAPLHHVEIVYDAVITRSRPTFYARSDSKTARSPYPVNIAASTHFVETNDSTHPALIQS